MNRRFLIMAISAVTASFTMLNTVLSFPVLAFEIVREYCRAALENAFNPVWKCIGIVATATKTLYGYAAKAPFRLIVYDR